MSTEELSEAERSRIAKLLGREGGRARVERLQVESPGADPLANARAGRWAHVERCTCGQHTAKRAIRDKLDCKPVKQTS